MPRRIDSTGGPAPLLALILALAAALLHWQVAAMPGGFLADGSLAGPDAWTRALRVLALHEGADWRDTTLGALSAPEGLSLPWTRPLDLLILAPSHIAMAFGVEAREAILWSAAWISPALHVAALAAGVWAAKALWPGVPAWFAAALLLCNSAVLVHAMPGRADHNMLVLLATLGTLGAGMRAAIDPKRTAQAWLAGLAGGFGVWISPDALLAVVPVLAGLGLAWLLAWDGRHHAAQGARAATGLAVMLALAIGTERLPADWLLTDADRVSIQHLAIAAAVGAGFLLALPLGRLPLWARLLAAVLLISAAGFALFWHWPHVWPASPVPADAGAALLLAAAKEIQPLRFGTRAELWGSLVLAGTALLALLTLALGLEFEGWLRNRRWTAAIMLAVALLAALTATLLQRRYALELAAPAAIAAAGLLPLLARLLMGAARLAALTVVAVPLLVLPYLAALVSGPSGAETPSGQSCSLGPLALFLRANPPVPAGAVMLADTIDLGPELAWRTPYQQTGAPYHLGRAALVDTRAILAATEDDAARAILARRSVRLMLLCRAAPPFGEAFPAGSLRERLLAGERPEGWAEVLIAPEVTGDFLLLSFD